MKQDQTSIAEFFTGKRDFGAQRQGVGSDTRRGRQLLDVDFWTQLGAHDRVDDAVECGGSGGSTAYTHGFELTSFRGNNYRGAPGAGESRCGAVLLDDLPAAVAFEGDTGFMAKKFLPDNLRAHLRAPQGKVDLARIRTAPTGNEKRIEEIAENRLADLESDLDEWQERLFAMGRSNPETAPRVLLILQGMDTAGKGGVIRNTIGLVDPQGTSIKAFKSPTQEELAHDFLWRIEKALPGPGMIGIFDRSQYEDVLIVRVDTLVPPDVWSKRYDIINDWEKKVTDSGCVILKCFLHISKNTQKERLSDRLEHAEKFWKYNPRDLEARAKWDAYTEAYEALLEKCNPDHAPWYIIPSDNEDYRNWAVAQLLHEHMSEMDLQWPGPQFDVAEQKRLLAAL